MIFNLIKNQLKIIFNEIPFYHKDYVRVNGETHRCFIEDDHRERRWFIFQDKLKDKISFSALGYGGKYFIGGLIPTSGSYRFAFPGLNEDEIIILLNEQNFKYETLNKLFDLIKNELNSSEIKTYDFLRSLLFFFQKPKKTPLIK